MNPKYKKNDSVFIVDQIFGLNHIPILVHGKITKRMIAKSKERGEHNCYMTTATCGWMPEDLIFDNEADAIKEIIRHFEKRVSDAVETIYESRCRIESYRDKLKDMEHQCATSMT